MNNNKTDPQIPHIKLNVKEIRELEGLTKEQYAEVKQQLSEIKKDWWFFPDYFWVAGFTIGIFCIFYFSQWIMQIIALIVITYCIAQLGYRSGVLYGYVRGYESGHEEGIHKALGITHEDALDIHDLAIELDVMLPTKSDMQIEERK